MEARGKSYCVMCLQEKRGIQVENDYVLEAARWFKKNITRNEKNNRLVVCRDCYAKYKKARARYESRQKIYLALGILFAVVGLTVSPQPGTLLFAIFLVALLFLFSLLNYTPRIDIKNKHKQ